MKLLYKRYRLVLPSLPLSYTSIKVVNSAKLKRLLAVVLAIGNFLNEDGHNGNADAITLESLLKLPTVRLVSLVMQVY